MAIRADRNTSLDGLATTTDPIPVDPIGRNWCRKVEVARGGTTHRTFRR